MKENEKTIRETLKKEWDSLQERERNLFSGLVKHKTISRDIDTEFHNRRTFGELVADGVATFGGS